MSRIGMFMSVAGLALSAFACSHFNNSASPCDENAPPQDYIHVAAAGHFENSCKKVYEQPQGTLHASEESTYQTDPSLNVAL